MCETIHREQEKDIHWQDGAECLTLDFSPHKEPMNQWKKLPDCDEFVGARRSKHTMVAYKGAIYVFGGDNGKQMLNDLIRFDPGDNSWGRAFTMGQMPAPRYHHTAVVFETSMYVFGGYTGDIHSNLNLANKNDLFEYKFCTGQWSELLCEGKLPPARSAHGAAVYNDKIWIFGGFDGDTRLSDMWSISLRGPLHKWEQVQQHGETPPRCCNFASCVVKDDMYLFSGQSGAKSTNCLFHFHFPTQAWTRISTEHILRGAPPPPDRRYGHTMVAHDRHLYVFGGAADSIHPPELHFFDLDSQVWSVIEPASGQLVPSRRLFHASVVVADGMFIFGGTVDNNVRSNEIHRFQLSSYPRCTLTEDFGRLLESRQFCDLRFLVGKDRVAIYAHAAIVAARSSFLLSKIKFAREQKARDPIPPVEVACPHFSSTQQSDSDAPQPPSFPSICGPAFSSPSPALPTSSDSHGSFCGSPQQQSTSPPLAIDNLESNSNNFPCGLGSNTGPYGSGNSKPLRDVNILDVPLPDAEPFAFEMVLDYMYTDKIDPTQRGQEPDSNGVVLLMMDVYRLALQFSMKRLEGLCVHYLKSMIGLKNVLAALQNGSRLNLNYIKEFCFKFVTKESNYSQIVMSKEFETLEQPLMVEIIRRRQIPTLRPPIEEPRPTDGCTLSDDMANFLNNSIGSEFCDLTLMCDGTAITAHKVILAGRSGYFEGMFRSFMPETNTVKVSLGEMVPSVHACRSLLRYIYYGCTEMPPEDSLYLFSAPCFYSFTNNRLQAFCKENLETNICWRNVLDILEAADAMHANEMKRHCLRLIVAHFSDVSNLPKLSDLSRELLLDIIGAVASRMATTSASNDVPSTSTSNSARN